MPSIETPRSTRFQDFGPVGRQEEIIVLDSPQKNRTPLYVQPAHDLHDHKRRKIELQGKPITGYERYEDHPGFQGSGTYIVPLASNGSMHDDHSRYAAHRREPERGEYTHLERDNERYKVLNQGSSYEAPRIVALPPSHEMTERNFREPGGSYVLRDVKDPGYVVKPSASTMLAKSSSYEHNSRVMQRRNSYSRPTYLIHSPTKGRSLRDDIRGPSLKANADHTIHTEIRDSQLERAEPLRLRRKLPLDSSLASLKPLSDYGKPSQADRPMVVRVRDEHHQPDPPRYDLRSRDFRPSEWVANLQGSRMYSTYEAQSPCSRWRRHPITLEVEGR